MSITKMDIAALRGGFPEKCSFCEKPMLPDQLEPEEAGDWACWYCLRRWAKNDGNAAEEAFWERRIKEWECTRSNG